MTKLWIYLGGLAVLALACWGAYHVVYQLGWGAAKAEDAPIIKTALEANAGQSKAITELQTANAAWAAKAKAQADQVAKLAAQAVKDRAAILAANRPRDTAPDCLKLETLPMATCPVRLKAIKELAP